MEGGSVIMTSYYRAFLLALAFTGTGCGLRDSKQLLKAPTALEIILAANEDLNLKPDFDSTSYSKPYERLVEDEIAVEWYHKSRVSVVSRCGWKAWVRRVDSKDRPRGTRAFEGSYIEFVSGFGSKIIEIEVVWEGTHL